MPWYLWVLLVLHLSGLIFMAFYSQKIVHHATGHGDAGLHNFHYRVDRPQAEVWDALDRKNLNEQTMLSFEYRFDRERRCLTLYRHNTLYDRQGAEFLLTMEGSVLHVRQISGEMVTRYYDPYLNELLFRKIGAVPLQYAAQEGPKHE